MKGAARTLAGGPDLPVEPLIAGQAQGLGEACALGDQSQSGRKALRRSDLPRQFGCSHPDLRRQALEAESQFPQALGEIRAVLCRMDGEV